MSSRKKSGLINDIQEKRLPNDATNGTRSHNHIGLRNDTRSIRATG